ncbi:MAG: metallophosphoesterase [bacterium]
MRTVVHLSDLHFGRVDHAVLAPLRRRIDALRPDLVVVSGDLTQRARAQQFRAARAFLDTLPTPQVVVPGNHDVPLYNVVERLLAPFARWRRHVSEDLEPQFIDAELAVIGVNTARALVFKGGRINETQVERLRAQLCDLGDAVTKIVVTHHPFDVPEGLHHGQDQIVGRAAMAMTALARCGVDLLLSGHLHASHTSHTVERYDIEGLSALVVQAGTATSTRQRGETNSFNVLRVDHPRLRVERYAWTPASDDFALASAAAYEHSAATGWRAVETAPAT